MDEIIKDLEQHGQLVNLLTKEEKEAVLKRFKEREIDANIELARSEITNAQQRLSNLEQMKGAK